MLTTCSFKVSRNATQMCNDVYKSVEIEAVYPFEGATVAVKAPSPLSASMRISMLSSVQAGSHSNAQPWGTSKNRLKKKTQLETKVMKSIEEPMNLAISLAG